MGEYYGVRRTGDEPYIEHWGVPKGWTKQGHKYLARLVSNTGKGYRYIYSQAELAAAKAGKLAGQAGKSVAKATGLAARNRAQATAARANKLTHPSGKGQAQPNPRNARMARATAKRAKAAYDKTLLGRAENAFNGARKAVGDAASEAGRQANKTYKAARKGVMNAAGDAQKYVNKQAKKAKKAYDDYQNFKKLPQWQKDIAVNADRKGVKKVMGRSVQGAAMASRLEGIENAIRNAPGNALKSARRAGEDISKGANEAYGRARKQALKTGRQISKAAGDAYGNATKAVNGALKEGRRTARKLGRATQREVRRAGRAVDRQLDNVGKATGYKALRRSVRTRMRANLDYNRQNKAANRTADAAEAAYRRTPLGKVDVAVSDATRRVLFGNKKRKAKASNPQKKQGTPTYAQRLAKNAAKESKKRNYAMKDRQVKDLNGSFDRFDAEMYGKKRLNMNRRIRRQNRASAKAIVR